MCLWAMTHVVGASPGHLCGVWAVGVAGTVSGSQRKELSLLSCVLPPLRRIYLCESLCVPVGRTGSSLYGFSLYVASSVKTQVSRPTCADLKL